MIGQTVTLGHIPRRNARLYPNRACLSCDGHQFTFAQFNGRVNRLANALQDLGVNKGDRVACLSLNCHRAVEAKFALAKLGGVEVPLNVRFVGREISYIVNDAAAKVFLLGEEFRTLVESVRADLKSVESYIAVGGGKGILDWETMVDSAPEIEPSVEVDENDVAIQMYTSGTTGNPKGCMLTHRNIIEASYAMIYEWHLGENDVVIAAQPIFHIAAGGLVFASLCAGAQIVIQRRFDAGQLLDLVQSYRATVTGLLPQAARMFLFHPDFARYDVSSLRLFITAYEPDLIRRAGEILRCEIAEYYGSTETTGTVTFHNHSKSEFRKTASCGREAINVEVKIVDEAGCEVPPGQVGEIIVRGPTVMKGYWGLPEDTAEVLKEGWFYTGDLAWMDDERYVYIVDRKKDMIRSGGENIYSKEVEDIIYLHEAVREVAVIGVPDERWGETVKAIVVLKPGASATEEEIIEHCKKYLASYKKPTSVEFVEGLPRSSTGKVLKRELREKYWAGYERRIK